MNRPNTPGTLGYALALLVSFAVFGALVGLYAVSSADGAGQAVAIAVLCVPLGALVAGTYGLPVALVGAAVLAVALPRVGAQVWHVLLAGVAGSALTPLYLAVASDIDGGGRLLLASAVGTAAALGRLAVVPLVTSRRRLAAEGRLAASSRRVTVRDSSPGRRSPS